MEKIKHYRAYASLCRQQAALHPDASWHWLAEAERYENLADTEIAEHSRNAMGVNSTIPSLRQREREPNPPQYS